MTPDRPMPHSTPGAARSLEDGKFNRFLAALPPHDFALLAPYLRTVALEQGWRSQRMRGFLGINPRSRL
jgi:hypothetical protein